MGDGAGVGKGRQIAGMIKEEHARGGTRTLWMSVSNDLRFDAERDLADVGAGHIPVFPKVPFMLPCARTQQHHTTLSAMPIAQDKEQLVQASTLEQQATKNPHPDSSPAVQL